ncbi:hypothetical protein KFK09_015700 [Dendrobium nobile]|uniref:Uncharacterized protein n=1 Tax=Dendrobium nobile TaxID=94219 RepID=A0A8T3B591_DENNO|nr:hypothetical protein KFK09_015700 [Dendrobium nobile]
MNFSCPQYVADTVDAFPQRAPVATSSPLCRGGFRETGFLWKAVRKLCAAHLDLLVTKPKLWSSSDGRWDPPLATAASMHWQFVK